MFMLGFPLDWDDYYMDKEEKPPLEQCTSDCRHEYEEIPSFNMTNWRCVKCGNQIAFDEIKKHHTIVSRCSQFTLPYPVEED